ncbi:hypothetical protein DdX_21422 [Ditylenchus destructor]|uniref:PhoU domain-containing protein n=1 Tax=Ditylenchus destructor TaxID=166010 RepID=A0AAD4QVA5_9BILA|nr:hypothetical protein DdX_21422 [Ditylenchus destructor]
MAEIVELHGRLVANLRLSMSVFLNGNVRDAQKLLEEKARFRDLERAYATTHLDRLSDRTTLSIETSSLHIDLISDLKRINSHICSIAYPILSRPGRWRPAGCASRGWARSGLNGLPNLHLVEEHQRQHDRAHRVRGEKHLRHRDAAGQALLGAAENDGDLVFRVEAQLARQQGREAQRQAEHHRAHHEQADQCMHGHLLPEPLDHGRAERGVDHQQDRALVDELQHRGAALDPLSDQRPQQVAGREGHHQLQQDAANGIQRGRSRMAAAGQHHQSSGVTSGQQDRLEHQPQHREQHEGAREHQQVQPPVHEPVDDRLARQLGPVQEEQQADGHRGQPSKKCAMRPLAGSRLARVTTERSARVKLSGRKRGRDMLQLGTNATRVAGARADSAGEDVISAHESGRHFAEPGACSSRLQEGDFRRIPASLPGGPEMPTTALQCAVGELNCA